MLARSAGSDGIHRRLPVGAPSVWSSEPWLVRDFRACGPRYRSALRHLAALSWPLLTSRSACVTTLPFQAPRARSPWVRTLTFAARSPDIRDAPVDHEELCDGEYARPRAPRLLSGFCSSTRCFVSRFLQTLGHPQALALPFLRSWSSQRRTLTSESVFVPGALPPRFAGPLPSWWCPEVGCGSGGVREGGASPLRGPASVEGQVW